MIIESGIGNGYSAEVNSDNQLLVSAIAESIEHHIAHDKELSFRLIGEDTGVVAATNVVVIATNDSADLDMVIHRINMQFLDYAGGTALPSVNTYFDLALGLTYSAGGSAVTPVNTNSGAGKVSNVTAYDTNPTLTGTAMIFDKYYVQEEGLEHVHLEEGGVVIRPGDAVAVRLVTDHTSGIAKVGIHYGMVDPTS